MEEGIITERHRLTDTLYWTKLLHVFTSQQQSSQKPVQNTLLYTKTFSLYVQKSRISTQVHFMFEFYTRMSPPWLIEVTWSITRNKR